MRMPFFLVKNFNSIPQAKIHSLLELKFHIRLMKFLGICPFKRNSLKSKVYALFLMGSLIIPGLYEIALTLFLYPEAASSLEKVLTLIIIGSFCSFILNLLYSNWKSRKSWRKLLGMLTKFEETFSIDASLKNNNGSIILRFVFIRIMPLFLSFTSSFLWYLDNLPSDLALIMTQTTAIFYEFQIATFMLELAYLIQSRYQHIQDLLREASLKVITNGGTESLFRVKIAKIKYKYGILYRTIEEINTIFSKTMLFYCIHVVIIFEVAIFWYQFAFDKGVNVILSAIIYAVLILVSLHAICVTELIALYTYVIYTINRLINSIINDNSCTI